MLKCHSFTPPRALVALLACLLFAPLAAWSQAWPAKPVKIVVPYAADGGTDVMAGTPEQFATLIEKDLVRFGKVIRDVGIKVE